MARNSAGTHSLPAATNPVVTGTTGTSTWANGTMSDLSTEITDSLSRSGKGGMLAPMRVADGSVAAPAHSFTGETGSGWFRESAGVLKLAILGVYRIAVTATLTTINSAASVLGTLLVSGKITGSAGAAVTGTLEVVDDGGTAKKISINAPTGLAADYALDLPAALPASTLPVKLSAAGALSTAQMVNADQNFGTPSAATDVVVVSFLAVTSGTLTNVAANLTTNALAVSGRVALKLAWFVAGTNPVTLGGPITGCGTGGDPTSATRLFTIPSGYVPATMFSANSIIPISWYDSSMSYGRAGYLVVNPSGDAYFWANDTAGAKLDLALNDQIYIGQGDPLWVTV